MATGSKHYQMAEELLAEITNDDGSVSFGDGGEAYAAAAQVHATLALAAASALSGSPDVPGGMPYDDFNTWYEVAREHVGNE